MSTNNLISELIGFGAITALIGAACAALIGFGGW